MYPPEHFKCYLQIGFVIEILLFNSFTVFNLTRVFYSSHETKNRHQYVRYFCLEV